MPSNIETIRSYLQQHYNEANGGLIEKSPSRLSRGEGTEKPYFIMKIDLVGSTNLFFRRQKSTYLKFAHTFLSSIDKITQEFDAEASQVEYAGDSVMAYFPASVTAEKVITAACWCRAAVMQMKTLDNTLRAFELKCKIVLDYADLIVANIGPRANSHLTAIGYPLHRVAKIEKEIGADVGRATENFYQEVNRDNKKYFEPVYREEQVPMSPTIPILPNRLISKMLGIKVDESVSQSNPMSDMLYDRGTVSPSPQAPQYKVERRIVGYALRWPLLFHALRLNEVR